MRFIHAPRSEKPKRKDWWDKAPIGISVLTFLSTLAIAGIGWMFTDTYKESELRAADLTIAEKMLPHLVKEGRQAEGALALLAILSRPEVAAEMAILYGGKSSIEAMERLAKNAKTASGKEAATRALYVLTKQGSAAEATLAASSLNGIYGWGSTVYSSGSTTKPPDYSSGSWGTTHPKYMSEVLVVSSGEKLSGPGKAFSSPYELCANAPPGHRIVDHTFRLVGDRSCGAWATCEKASESESTVCYRFRLQGHEERPPPGQAVSEGVLRATVARK